MKVLILRFSSIGDIVLTSPVVRCVKEQIPGAEVHYLTKVKFAGLLDANPNIQKVHALGDDFSETIKLLKSEKFDVIIDLHNNLRSLRIKWNLRVRSYTFKKLNIRKWLFVNFKLKVMPSKHIVQRYMEACAGLGVKYDGRGLDYFFNQKQQALPVGLPKPPFIAFAIGGTYNTKKLSKGKIHELIQKIQLPVVIIGDHFDNAYLGELGDLPPHVFNVCGKVTFDQSAQILLNASSVITHDTGMMHIAAALNKSIVSIWGNTVAEFGMTPYFPDHHNSAKDFISEVSNLDCRPCSKLGFESCPKGHFNCMEMQDIDRILEKLL